MVQQVDFDQKLVDASKITRLETAGATQRPLFFLYNGWDATICIKRVQT